jgi:antitoxin YefM
MDIVTFTNFRSNLAAHLDKIEEERVELIVTRQNRPPYVVMPLSEGEGMKETLHLLSSPANAAHLLASVAQADAGMMTEHELIEP